MVRALVRDLDKKVDDEISFRLKSEDEMRHWFEQRIQIIKEMRNADENRAVEREKRITHQLS